MGSYVCGSYELVQRDLEAVFSSALAGHVDSTLRRLEVPEAFFIRQELVNFKKVMLYLHEQGLSLERSLAQLNTFLNYDMDGSQSCLATNDDYWAPSVWSAELIDTHMKCKGRCMATADVRRFCKDICCFPRHPDEPVGPRGVAIERLPGS